MGKTIIHSVLLFDGHDVKPEATVEFDSNSGTITKVSSDSSGPYASDATVIDGSGHTLLPGLIEAHMHAHGLHLQPGEDGSFILTTPLKCGITTVCDMHSPPEDIHKLKDQVKQELGEAKQSGKVTRSDLKSCLYGATIEGGWPKPIVLGHNPPPEVEAQVKTWPNVTVETAADFVKSHKSLGADYIKLMQEDCCSLAMPTGSVPSASLELQTAVTKAAHAEGFFVLGHAISHDNTAIILKSGADGLAHTFVDQAPTEEIISLYKQTGGFVVPTLVVCNSLTAEGQDEREKFAEIASKKGLLSDAAKANMLDLLGMKAEGAKIQYSYDTIARLHKEGIDVLAGTDSVAGLKGTAIGPSLWHELTLYVEKCGFSVLDALKSATSVTSRRFKFNDRGVIEAGRRADLILVKGDATLKLECLWEGLESVWKQGIPAAR